jgi:hypothetical protein
VFANKVAVIPKSPPANSWFCPLLFCSVKLPHQVAKL